MRGQGWTIAATAHRLREIRRPVLAALLEREGELPLVDYAAALHAYRPSRPLEPAMAAALRHELARIGLPPVERDAACARFEHHRVVQTTTHVTLAEGPFFLASHYVASLGLAADAPFLVAACSGIAFSNNARPGCLSFARIAPHDLFDPASPQAAAWRRSELDRARFTPEQRLSLIPGSQRSALVFGATVDAATVDRVRALRGPIRDVLPVPRAGESFTAWAVRGHRALHGRVLGRSVVTLDINEVLRGYLLAVLDRGDHPLHRVLFDPDVRARVLGPLPDLPLFVMPVAAATHGELAPLRLAGDQLRAPHATVALEPAAILAGLHHRTLCAGTFLEFAALAFLNDVCCLGGVDQLEYLAMYRRAWLAEPRLPAPSDVPLDRLASGRFLDAHGGPILAVDLLYGAPFTPPADATLAGFLAPQLDRLLGRPFPWAEPA